MTEPEDRYPSLLKNRHRLMKPLPMPCRFTFKMTKEGLEHLKAVSAAQRQNPSETMRQLVDQAWGAMQEEKR